MAELRALDEMERLALTQVAAATPAGVVKILDFGLAPEQIRDRLRKGPPMSRGEGAAEHSLKTWKSVYQRDLRAVFPGPFPLSPKLKDLYRRHER